MEIILSLSGQSKILNFASRNRREAFAFCSPPSAFILKLQIHLIKFTYVIIWNTHNIEYHLEVKTSINLCYIMSGVNAD